MTSPDANKHDLAATCDIAILTVQETELESLLRNVTVVHVDDSTQNMLFHVEAKRDGQSGTNIEAVVMPLRGVGRVEAAIATSQLLHRVSPRWLLLLGVAGGFSRNGVDLGDIIVADTIIDYEMQRISADERQFRWRNFHVDPHLLTVSRSIEATTWSDQAHLSLGHHPKVHFGPVLSGDKVVASEETVSSFLELNHELIGIEMEGAGVAAALLSSHTPPGLLMIRGVVDLANERKREDSRLWLSHACDVVAMFTVETMMALHSARATYPQIRTYRRDGIE